MKKETMLVTVETSEGDYFEGLVAVGTDLDSSFTLTTEEGENLTINGWCCEVEEI